MTIFPRHTMTDGRRNRVTGASRRLAVRPASVLVLAALVLTGCVQKTDSGSSGDTISLINDGKLTVCTQLPFKPFQFAENNKTVGFDVDLLDLVARELDVTQEIVDTSFEGIESGEVFNAGKCDLAAAAMTITDTRRGVMDFSDPYFDSSLLLVTKKGSGVRTLADLRGKVLGTQQKTTGEKYALENQAKYGYETKQFEDLVLMATAAATGNVDAAINDNGVLMDYAKSNPDLETGESFPTDEKYGIGMRKGATALQKKVNEALAKAKSSGEYEKIYVKWFGNKPAN